MFPFFAISLVKHFYILQFLHYPQGRGLCSLCHFQGAFWDRSSRWASCYVCVMPWTPSKCSGSGAAGCSAHWLWLKEQLASDVFADGDLDVAEQVEGREKVLKKFVSFAFMYKVRYSSSFSCRCAWAFSWLLSGWLAVQLLHLQIYCENWLLAPARTHDVKADAASS